MTVTGEAVARSMTVASTPVGLAAMSTLGVGDGVAPEGGVVVPLPPSQPGKRKSAASEAAMASEPRGSRILSSACAAHWRKGSRASGARLRAERPVVIVAALHDRCQGL